MNQTFSISAYVAIQGKRVLRFIDFAENQVVYEIIGFTDRIVRLVDRRASGLRAISELQNTGNPVAFAPMFNGPALVTIIQDEQHDEIQIELSEPSESTLEHILWIAIGIGDLIPVYNYIYEHIEPLDENHYALIAVYHALSTEIPAFESSVLISASSSP
jgi:hypothetical protein